MNLQQGKNTTVDFSKILLNKNSHGKIIIGDYVKCFGELYCFLNKGNISIGDYSYIGVNTRIWALESIDIGNRVLISHNVTIMDNRTHPLNHEIRHMQYKAKFGYPFPQQIELDPKKISIGDDVLLSANSIILRGVNIGSRAIIAAGSVVTNDVPSDVIVAGNPAKIVKRII